MRDDANADRDLTEAPGADGPGKGARESDTEALPESFADADARQQQLQEQQDKYLRLAAEYDNFRKRATRERQEAAPRAQGELVKQIIESLDDLGRVIAVDPATTDATAVIHGVELVENKLLKSLAAAGLEVVNPIDEPFDPEFQEAVSTEPALSREDDHLVSRVYQLGYVFKGQLLRPARVVVKQWNG